MLFRSAFALLLACGWALRGWYERADAARWQRAQCRILTEAQQIIERRWAQHDDAETATE